MESLKSLAFMQVSSKSSLQKPCIIEEAYNRYVVEITLLILALSLSTLFH